MHAFFHNVHPDVLGIQMYPEPSRVLSFCVPSLLPMAFPKLRMEFAQISLQFLIVCQADDKRHLIKGLLKCSIQCCWCALHYSCSATPNKPHFDYTVIFQSIHLPDKLEIMGDQRRHTYESIMNFGSSPPLCPWLPLWCGWSLAGAFLKIKWRDRWKSSLNGNALNKGRHWPLEGRGFAENVIRQTYFWM